MKKTLLSFFLLLIVHIISAQKIGTKWIYHTHSFSNWFNDTVSTLTYTKDTLVEGKNCRMMTLTMNVDSTFEEDNFYNNTYSLTYQEANKLYNYSFLTKTFNLIYDFDAKVDDVWELSNGLIVYVDSISYQNFNGEILKNLHVTYYQYDPFLYKDRCSVITEKLGDQSYYFMYTQGDDPGEFMPYRLSRLITDSLDYQNLNPKGINCKRRVFVGLEEQEKTLKNSFYPSIASDKLFCDANLTELELRIFDANGNSLQPVVKDNFLDVKSLQGGIYILNIIQPNGNSEQVKFIKE